MDQMKILLVGNSQAGGGVSRYIEGITKLLTEFEPDITFKDLKDVMSNYPRPLEYSGMRNELKKILLMKELTHDFWKQISNENYNLIHFLNFNLSILPCLFFNKKKRTFKIIKTSHGMWSKEELFQGFIPRVIYKPILSKIQETIQQKIDGVIYVSNAQEKEFKEKFNLTTQNTYVTYLSSPLETYDGNIDKLISEKKDKIIYVGRIEPRKNLQLFLNLARELSMYEFNIIGHGENVNYLEELSRIKPKNVSFLLDVTDEELVTHYRAAKFFVSFSKWENCPISYLESVSQGTPVIATSQNIKPLENKCGFMVESVDDAVKIINKIQGDYSKYVRLCIYVSKEMSWEKVKNETLMIYEKLSS